MNVHYNERWAQGVVLQWLNEVIRDLGVSFVRADQEVQLRTVSGLAEALGRERMGSRR